MQMKDLLVSFKLILEEWMRYSKVVFDYNWSIIDRLIDI